MDAGPIANLTAICGELFFVSLVRVLLLFSVLMKLCLTVCLKYLRPFKVIYSFGGENWRLRETWVFGRRVRTTWLIRRIERNSVSN